MARHDRPAAADVLGRVQAARVQRADYARQVATAIGADAHEVVIDDHDFFGALPRLVWHEDEPIAHPSSVPLYFVSALAREHVKVVLTGEGSDELLAGYGKYPRALVNWRAGGVYERRAAPGARAGSPTRSCRGCRAGAAAMRSRSFLAMPRTPEAMFFDNFAAIGLARQRDAARAALRRQPRPRTSTARRASTSTRRTATARCSTACSTPISRPISSSC